MNTYIHTHIYIYIYIYTHTHVCMCLRLVGEWRTLFRSTSPCESPSRWYAPMECTIAINDGCTGPSAVLSIPYICNIKNSRRLDRVVIIIYLLLSACLNTWIPKYKCPSFSTWLSDYNFSALWCLSQILALSSYLGYIARSVIGSLQRLAHTWVTISSM